MSVDLSFEMTRHEKIHKQLDWCESKKIIRSWQKQSNMPGTRWTLEGYGFTTRVYSTAEVEAFILGASEGRTSTILEPPPN